jgi:leader peptidase (prepilin peptidase)/N-methyltransferase
MPANPASLLQGALFVSALLWAAVSDGKRKEIPTVSIIIIALAGLIHFSPAKLWGCTIAIPFLIAALCKHGGFGDALLTAICAIALGLPKSVFGLSVGCVLYIVYYIIQRIWYKRKPKSGSDPLVPFLAPGFIAAYFI